MCCMTTFFLETLRPLLLYLEDLHSTRLRMDFEEINRILFFTLNDICPIGTSRISMMSIDDRYAGYPFLRFRFKEKDKNDVIYSKIRDAVKDFKGLLSWEMITFNDVPNYLILQLKAKKKFESF